MIKIRISERDRERFARMSEIEADYHRQGYRLIAGVDEAGRGPLAGPVFAAACILPKDVNFYGLNDSKKMTERRREALYEQITAKAVAWQVCSVSAKQIDEINILQASRKAMTDALKQLNPQADLALVDAVSLENFSYPVLAMTHGDANCNAIAAASVLAKVSRDRLMQYYDLLYPQYNFANNKGYGTKEHIAALETYGACPIHRRSFLNNFAVKKIKAWRAGERAEAFLATELSRMGYKIIARNVQIDNLGELDIVAIKNEGREDVLCVIEVKARGKSAESFGGSVSALTNKQISRIKRTALAFAQKHDFDELAISLQYAACDLDEEGNVINFSLLPMT